MKKLLIGASLIAVVVAGCVRLNQTPEERVNLNERLEKQKRAAKEAARKKCYEDCKKQFDATLLRSRRTGTTESLFLIRSNKAFITFVACTNECNSKGPPEPLDLGKEVDLGECLDGGATCEQPVPEWCTISGGPCNDCWKNLCPDWGMELSSDTPLSITLLAASDLQKNARTLAASSKANRVSLSAPRDIKLEQGEKLWLRFEFSEKPVSPKVTVHWRAKR
jgi:hypothetical protein